MFKLYVGGRKSENTTRRLRARKLGLEVLQRRELMAGDVVGIEIQPAINISNEEQLMIELVNRARANPVAEATAFGIDLNRGLSSEQAITSTAKNPLAPNEALQQAAELHSKDLLDRDYFAHQAKAPAPNGIDVSNRASKAGYGPRVGENLSLRSLDRLSNEANVLLSHEGLIKSDGHRRNMMIDSYQDIGVGIENGAYSGIEFKGRTLESMAITENFGSGSANLNRAITGVVYTDAVKNDDFYNMGEGVAGVRIEASAADGATYATMTSTSGGYALRVPAGTYRVHAQGETLAAARFLGVVEIGNTNVKLDVALDQPADNSNHDVNADGAVSPIDVLQIINVLAKQNRDASIQVDQSRCDVNLDGQVTPLDVLVVINELSRRSRSGQPKSQAVAGEGESAGPLLANQSVAHDAYFEDLGSEQLRKGKSTTRK